MVPPATPAAPSIAVIGAGASGLMAALFAAWSGAPVTLFERNDTIGRKLLVTGSGRCNLSNDAADPAAYACADPAWLEQLFATFGRTHLLETLQRIGVPTFKTHDGWYYPLSESAQSVVQAFSTALDLAGVTRQMASRVTGLTPRSGRWAVSFTSGGTDHAWTFDRLILAAGGMAMPALGSRGELFPALAPLGHTVLPLRPALAPLLLDLGRLKPLQGLHFDLTATLYFGGQVMGRATGNLIFTAWGLNGPAVMDLSHLVSARPDLPLALSLDFLAPFQRQYDELLAARESTSLPLVVFLSAFFPPKAAAILASSVGLAESTPLNQLPHARLKALTARLNDTRLPVKGVRDWDYCQVSAGGVPVTEVEPRTLASLRAPGLYLTGETLDVVGPCGGYNLQFAFSSGALAGIGAART